MLQWVKESFKGGIAVVSQEERMEQMGMCAIYRRWEGGVMGYGSIQCHFMSILVSVTGS